MGIFLIIENPKNWRVDVPGVEVVSARDYLTNPRFSGIRRAKVFNLCRTYKYQTIGYYVSLLAAARGHKPMPSVSTIQGLRTAALVRLASEEIDHMMQTSLAALKSERFSLSIYFGRNMAKRYDKLCQALFNHFPAPFLRAELALSDRWRLESLRPIASNEIPEDHRDFLVEQARRYFAHPRHNSATQYRYELAILLNPEEQNRPSNDKAIQKFIRAAKTVGLHPTLIGKEEFGRLAEYDALFIRETTAVNHHTYRFARRAEIEGMVVIDDPESIIRCTNKVYLAEVFARHGIASPKTLIVHRENAAQVGQQLGFPCVLKRPDSSFSLGVKKAHNQEELSHYLTEFFQTSELVVAQEFVPSSFDWRIGVLAGRPLYACKYHMARGHWQIQKVEGGENFYGKVETIPVESAPKEAVDLGVKSASIIGDGLYGVDVKEVDGRFMVMEVNDNPSLDAGFEDAFLKDELYLSVMRTFYERLEQRGKKDNQDEQKKAAKAV